MTTNNQKIVQSMINAQWLREKEINANDKLADRGHTVTVSRQCGSFGESVAQTIAKQLKVTYFDKQFVEEIAQSAGIEADLFRQLEQKIRRMKPTYLETVFSDRPWLQAKYNKNLMSVLLGISRVGGVVLGRGANYVLGQSACFRLRIVAPRPVRVSRVMDRLGIDAKDAEEKVQKVDTERANFVKSIYGMDIDNPDSYDLTISTERYSPELAAELAIAAAKLGQFCEPHSTLPTHLTTI